MAHRNKLLDVKLWLRRQYLLTRSVYCWCYMEFIEKYTLLLDRAAFYLLNNLEFLEAPTEVDAGNIPQGSWPTLT